MYSSSVEDYLAAIFRSEFQGLRGTTTAIAQKLGVSPASTTAMFQKLAQENLVVYAEYMGVTLTDDGQAAAKTVIRKHRLVERFLTDVLEIPWDRVHDMAHAMEHAVPAEVVERFDLLLGRPTCCPHGYPIPAEDGRISALQTYTLDKTEPSARCSVCRVDEEDSSLLEYLASKGLVPGAQVHVIDKSAFDDVVRVRIAERELTVGPRVSQSVHVTFVDAGSL